MLNFNTKFEKTLIILLDRLDDFDEPQAINAKFVESYRRKVYSLILWFVFSNKHVYDEINQAY